MDKYYPEGDKTDAGNVVGYSVAADPGAGAEAMRRRPDPRKHHEAGGEPARTSRCRCCCPGSRSTPSPTDFAPIKQMQMARFDGERWELFGPGNRRRSSLLTTKFWREVNMRRISRRSILAAAPGALALAAPFLSIRPARAAKQYGPGVSDTEIKIGNTGFYSGPASSYGTIGKAESAYFRMLNDQGGVNGRKINFISYDDAYSPAEDGRADPPAGRRGRCIADAEPARYADQQRDLALPEPEEGAAAVRCDRRHQMGRPETLPMDDRLAAQLPERGARLCGLHPGAQAGWQRSGCSTRTTISARTI